MRYLTIGLFVLLISCLFVYQANAFIGGGSKVKTESKGKCSLYKGRCGGISNTCCKAPYKCSKQTAICGKDKLCCVSEADIQRHKQQQTGNWVADRNG